MIFMDTNIFLRFLVAPTTDRDRIWHVQASELMEAIEAGSVPATTSEVVIHEVCFVLGSKHQYAMEPANIVERMRSVLLLAGMRFDREEGTIYLRALDLWKDHPKLGFADSVIAARCMRSGHELATFDKHFADMPSLMLWQPESSPPRES